jgi:hypothetical protein
MRKFMALVVILAVVACAIPALAESGKGDEKSVFQIIANTIQPGQAQESKAVTTFQDMVDRVKESSARARDESLRTTK